MPKDPFQELHLATHRYKVFLRDVLEPAVYGPTAPLKIEAAQFAPSDTDPPTYEQARAATYRPVELGWAWGPKWSTAWFRLTGAIPDSMRGRPVALRFSSGTEALLWSADGVPVHGLDSNRDAIRLFESARGGVPIRLHIEAACNHPFGVLGFDWDPPELRRRWESPTPGLLERADLAVLHPLLWDLRCAYAFAIALLLELPTDQSRHHQLNASLRRATNLILDTDPEASARPALEILNETLRISAAGSAPTGHAVGHAHIDTAWLWPARETKRKCLRTFATVLRNMERFPDFRFLCSQAQQYAWVEERSPALFEQIRARVAEGRWEPGGAMWIEPDANIISGESLIRQILHGERYWRSRFGAAGRQRFLYLPDTFGFCPALPQIMAQAGLDTFITNKMIWSQFNTFPHTTFRWRGLDGTEILTHFTPGHDYNASNTPKQLRHAETHHRNRDQGRAGASRAPGPARFLQPFGFGDGGGGPTDWSIRYTQLAADCDGLPRMKLSTAGEFCDGLHADHASLRAAGEDLPVWSGELYLELHRGTLTTQARIKRANLRAEQSLRLAELLCANSPTGGPMARAELDEAWKLTLLNQFHDIIPGSSIGPVYDDAIKDHARIEAIATGIIERSIPGWIERLGTDGIAEPIAVFNPGSRPRSGIVEVAGPGGEKRPVFASEVPALGIAVVDAGAGLPCPVHAASAGDSVTLSNGVLTAVIDAYGRITSLRRGAAGREVCAAGPLNQLVLYEDRPTMWDAWDIDWFYAQKPCPISAGTRADVRILSAGPARADVEIAMPVGESSRLTQIFRLDVGSPRLDIITRVGWHESRRLLRALFPTDVVSDHATYGTQLGHIRRPTHRNTSWDMGRFEVCAHRFADLSEPGFGLALLADCKYGYSAHDSTLGLSLLRSPKWPDPDADMGDHEFTYALMPHDGDWRAAGVDAEGEALAAPMRARPVEPRPGKLNRWSPFRISTDGPVGIAVDAFKPAHDDDRLILRLHEHHGGRGTAHIDWNIPPRAVAATDLLEQPTDLRGLEHRSDLRAGQPRTSVPLRPFQIVTLAISM
ncbi:MAG: alpha-mannosidase [Phycisphaerales bacterium]|nr:alpha-mannosidase [Phycisphaerales bacterium]